MKNRVYDFSLYFVFFAILSVIFAYIVFLEIPKNNVISIVLGHIAALAFAAIITLRFKRYRAIKSKIIKANFNSK